ncbi:hypothetical protein BDP81DRAFT_502412 [Colletotrichum phormii]|uniref:Ankyrin repeat protein n=1 Tax=Colletotrichum phormii TaxID=359342 RepID=A0AAI9ZGY3_9PEZI|nr:uncharacterized protein BDP81DRAFT_502412 [Colletotrichum phormii]KAK1624067.1 hypothetical protein BDP81DRAFT_502412 [Colletotrichum phormii]
MEVAGLVVGAFGVLPLAKECLQLANKHIGPSKHDTTELKLLTGWLDDIIQMIAILHPLLKSVDAGGQPLHAQYDERLRDTLDRCRQAFVVLNERLSGKNFLKKWFKGAKFDQKLETHVQAVRDAPILLIMVAQANQQFIIQETKQYLEQIPKSVDGVHDTLGELGQAVENFRDDFRSTAGGIQDQLRQRAEAESRREVLDWVSTRTFVLEQPDLLNLRYERTGTWFLECQNFKTWLCSLCSKEKYRVLFCSGGIGAGKTMITATVIDHLRSKYRDRDGITFAYVYCDYKNRSLDTSTSLLRSILRQVLEALPLLPVELEKMYERKDTLPSTLVKEILRESILMITGCFIVIDAIDELEVFGSNERAQMLDIIDDLRRQPNVRLFITSRPIDAISCQFNPTNSLIQEVCAETQDLERYLGGRVQKLSAVLRRHPELQNKVKDAIIGVVDGMFLLAQLFLDSFETDLNVAAVNKRLGEFQRDAYIAQSGPNGSDEWKRRLLCKAYDGVLERIKTQEHSGIAMQALTWITHATRRLQINELIEALAASLNNGQLEKDSMYEPEDIASACGGLIVVDKTSGIVRLSHYALQEYFEATERNWFPRAHYDISGICGQFSKSKKSLLGYAANNWCEHVRRSEAPILHEKVQELLDQRPHVDFLARIGGDTEASPLHVAAALGIDIEVTRILSNNKIQFMSRISKTGHRSIMRSFIETKPLSGRALTPGWLQAALVDAICNGNLRTVLRLHIAQELLSDERTNVDLKVGLISAPRSALSHAVERNHEAMVEQLLAAKAKVLESLPFQVSMNRSRYGTSFLNVLDGAVVQGNPDIMEKVFRQAPHFDFKSKQGRYLTCTAAYFASLNGLKFLIDNGAVADGADTTRRTPFSYLVEGLKFCDFDSPDGGYDGTHSCFLHFRFPYYQKPASLRRVLETAQLLIDNGAQVDLSDQHGRTALSYSGHSPEYTDLCLQLEATVDPKDLIGRTPLSYATEIPNSDGSVVGILLLHGAEPNSRDVAGRTPLWFAVQAGSSGNIRRLMSYCADSALVISKDGFGKNAITMSVKCALIGSTDWSPSCFDELLRFNADPSEGPEILDQPLLLAARLGHQKVYEQLLEKGASIGYKVPLQLDSLARDMLRQNYVWVTICSICCRPIPASVCFQVCKICRITVCLT